MTEPREWTDDEVREKFLAHVRTLISYWAGEGGSNVDPASSRRDALEGLAHSIMCIVDGNTLALPAFVLAPAPHPDDEAFMRSEGENWYPSASGTPHDIGGSLRYGVFEKSK